MAKAYDKLDDLLLLSTSVYICTEARLTWQSIRDKPELTILLMQLTNNLLREKLTQRHLWHCTLFPAGSVLAPMIGCADHDISAHLFPANMECRVDMFEIVQCHPACVGHDLALPLHQHLMLAPGELALKDCSGLQASLSMADRRLCGWG
jgi:hypothetical protein